MRLHTGRTGGLVVGGQPLRVLRLNPAAAAVVRRWQLGDRQVGERERAMAGRLHDAGLGDLRLAPTWTPADVTVVVPVRDRAAALERCLSALGPLRVLVVDDASADGRPLAEVAGRHGADLLVRPVNGGPGAARNTGLAAVTTDLVAFVDSDCQVPPGWLTGLLDALGTADAVAPRIVGAGGPGVLARFEVDAGPLDQGQLAGPVRPGSRVGHVPAAVLLCRRGALEAGFDETLRVGEDVDLVWRLTSVRYAPDVVVRHATRPDLPSWLRQRHGYGASAAPLDARHPGRLAPVVVSRWSLPALALLLGRRPGWALAATALAGVGLRSKLPDAPGRSIEAARLATEGLGWTVLGLADAAARPWLPALLPLSVGSRPVRRALAGAVGLRLWRARRTRSGGLVAWAALRVVDDLAYAGGVWTGALTTGRAGPLLPRIS